MSKLSEQLGFCTHDYKEYDRKFASYTTYSSGLSVRKPLSSIPVTLVYLQCKKCKRYKQEEIPGNQKNRMEE